MQKDFYDSIDPRQVREVIPRDRHICAVSGQHIRKGAILPPGYHG